VHAEGDDADDQRGQDDAERREPEVQEEDLQSSGVLRTNSTNQRTMIATGRGPRCSTANTRPSSIAMIDPSTVATSVSPRPCTRAGRIENA
jgi:hypothetical protein